MNYNIAFDDKRGEFDKVYKSMGVEIFCDLQSWLYLKGTTIDFSDDILSGGFRIDNPNASRTCGCGTSFSVQKMSNDTIHKQLDKKYEFGFTTDVEQETLPPGLSEDVIRTISAKKEEPAWLLEWRLNAYEKWKKMKEMGKCHT